MIYLQFGSPIRGIGLQAFCSTNKAELQMVLNVEIRMRAVSKSLAGCESCLPGDGLGGL